MDGNKKENKPTGEAKVREYESKVTKRSRRRKRSGIIVMIIVVIFVILATMVGFFTDWLWFKDLGYSPVYLKKIVTELEIGVPVFLVAMLLVRIYLKSLKNGYFKKIESHEITNAQTLNRISWGLAVLSGIAAAVICSRDVWLDFLKFVHSTDFGLKDPLFNLDISFYVFRLAFRPRSTT